MNRVIDTEEVFEEDEEDNEYMVKLKTDNGEVILEKCVQKDNKAYVSLNEILEVYDKLDNDNLSTETEEVPFYSYGFVAGGGRISRSGSEGVFLKVCKWYNYPNNR